MKINILVLMLTALFFTNYAMSQDLSVCGRSVDLNANVENYSSFSWFCDGVNGTFSNSHSLNTTFTLANDVNLQSFLDVRFYYNASVNGEIASDTIDVRFYKQPSARISMSEGDTVACGLTCGFLSAEYHGTGGFWYENNSSTVFNPVSNTTTSATVTSYGSHNFYWVECNGSDDNPQFCMDTAGPWTINFIRQPYAQIGYDELTFCGYNGSLHSNFNGIGEGRWSTNVSQNILTIEDRSNPNTVIHTTLLNSGNTQYPYYEIYWTVQNTMYCVDKDTVRVVFAEVPSSMMNVISPKCFGGTATITAQDETLPIYNWQLGNGIVDSTMTNSAGGEFRVFVHWNDNQDNHSIDMTAINSWGCQSNIERVVINEPNRIDARFVVSTEIDLNNIVAPDAYVIFENRTNYGGITNKICEWHFGDDSVKYDCDRFVNHVYAEPDCYVPYLIVINGDIQECRDTAYLNDCLYVSNDIADYNLTNISISPNPATDILNITSSETISEIEIVNVMGQVVRRIEVNSDSAVCNVEDLKDGVYVVRIYSRPFGSAQGAALRKFVKE